MKYVTLFLLFICFNICGQNQVPAETYKQLFCQLEVAYEDLTGIVHSKDEIIKAQIIEIIQLKKQIKERGKQS